MEPTIRPLAPEDAEAYVHLRRVMLDLVPTSFLASPEDDIGCDVEVMRTRLAPGSESAIYGLFLSGLQGAVGVYREGHRKASHKAGIWGMFVAPELRRCGLGRRLLEAAIAHARTLPGVTQVQLGVSEDATHARALYESCGFRVWGREPDALRHNGRSVAEDHMVLMLLK